MIETIIKQVQDALRKAGLDSIVSTTQVVVDKSVKQVYLGSDINILTGIRLNASDLMGDVYTICISSPTESLMCTGRTAASYGTSIFKIFKSHMTITSCSASREELVKYKIDGVEAGTPEYDGSFGTINVSNIPAYALEFVKITPINQ